MMKRTFFLILVLEVVVGLHRTGTSASLASVVGTRTYITVMLNGLPWKRTEIILSFLSLYPSTAFQTLLLTMRASQFLPRDSCP